MKSLGLIISLLILIGSIYSEGKSKCENQCKVCQKTIYKLKFQKSADCSNSHCKSTVRLNLKQCNKVWSLWNRPRSPLAGFNGNSIGKCDACFRAGFCSVTECEAQKALEKTAISRVVNNAKLSGFVDSSIMKKMMKKIMNNKKVNFKKYAKKVKNSIKKGLNNKLFKRNFKQISESLKLLAAARSKKDVKIALKSVNNALAKAEAGNAVKNNIRKINDRFKALVDNNTSKAKAGKNKKIAKSARKMKAVLTKELARISKYAKKVKSARDNVESSLNALKNKKTLSDKTKGKISKLEVILKKLSSVLNSLRETQSDLNATIETIKKAVNQFSH